VGTPVGGSTARVSHQNLIYLKKSINEVMSINYKPKNLPLLIVYLTVNRIDIYLAVSELIPKKKI